MCATPSRTTSPLSAGARPSNASLGLSYLSQVSPNSRTSSPRSLRRATVIRGSGLQGPSRLVVQSGKVGLTVDTASVGRSEKSAFGGSAAPSSPLASPSSASLGSTTSSLDDNLSVMSGEWLGHAVGAGGGSARFDLHVGGSRSHSAVHTPTTGSRFSASGDADGDDGQGGHSREPLSARPAVRSPLLRPLDVSDDPTAPVLSVAVPMRVFELAPVIFD